MRNAVMTFVVIFGLGLFAGDAHSQSYKKGTLSGIITSSSVIVPSNGATNVLTTATGTRAGFFILTQVCVDDSSDMQLTGSTVGPIPLEDDCTTYEPGYALPQGEVLTFTETNGNGSQAAMVTGVQSRK